MIKKPANLLFLLFLASLLFCSNEFPASYDDELVYIAEKEYSGNRYLFVDISRAGERMNAKYFASNKYSSQTVAQRFKEWSVGKNKVLVCSGTYMDNCYGLNGDPVGLCIDNGKIINRLLTTKGLDALVVVYATGGIAVSDLSKGNLTITDNSTKQKMTLDIREAEDLEVFIDWAEREGATVFQTHLLAYSDSYRIYSNSSAETRPRRVMCLWFDQNGVLYHTIAQTSEAVTLYKATQSIFDYLKNYNNAKSISSIINLDRGCQDFFTVYDYAGKEITKYNGDTDISNTVNLVAYYYK